MTAPRSSIRAAARSLTPLPPPTGGVPIATALRAALARGYGLSDLRADVLAGVVVGIVALPLSMALAVAVGAPPQHGLYTSVVAGAVVALLGGCRFQVTGPTAAFVVVLAPVLNQHGLGGLLAAGLMAGVMLVLLGLARLGTLIQFVPHPVTTGFTTGIATVIATLQLKDVFGLATGPMPDQYTDKLLTLWRARASASWAEFAVAALTLGLLLGVPRLTRRVPAPLIAIGVVTACVAVLHATVPGFTVMTLGTRFHTLVNGVSVPGIPAILPTPAWPFGEQLTLGMVRELLPSAFAIALLGAIESLLCGVIGDGMTGTKHDPNAELVALGIGNILAPLFGGIAATGALARTATNIRTGARSPLAAATHAGVVLLSILLLAPLVAHVPMAALAGLLLMVAWNMSEIHGFIGVLRVAPKSDVLVLLTCYGLTVLFDMVLAVSVGFVLAALLFMRRMAESVRIEQEVFDDDSDEDIKLPKSVLVYRVEGPFFFGAAEKLESTLERVQLDVETVVIRLGRVPFMDATGIHTLTEIIQRFRHRRVRVILCGIHDELRITLDAAGILALVGEANICASMRMVAERVANGDV